MLEFLYRKITRRSIQITLGVLWLVDGALQLQPHMFTSQFINNVILPAADGQPAFVSSPIHFAIRIFLHQPILFNTLIAIVQLGIGVLILWKHTVKLGLLGSILWGLFVWYFGEALGGLASGQTLLLMGAPGAALLYSIISVGVWPKNDDRRPAYWLAIVWVVVWLGGALLQLVNGQNTTADLAAMVRGMADGAPGWLAAIDIHVSNWLASLGNWFMAVFIIVQALIGFMVFLPRYWRLAAIKFGVLLSLAFWIIGQSLGAYYTGLATDPSTAPLIILLGLAILGTRETDLGLFVTES